MPARRELALLRGVCRAIMDRDGVKGLAPLLLASLAGCFARVFKVAFTQNAGHITFTANPRQVG